MSTWTSSRAETGHGRGQETEGDVMGDGNGNYKHTMETPGRKLVMTRVFDAPREVVFEAHTSCEHMSHWWGPRKYEVVSCDIDFRTGGTWRIVHRGPDGNEVTFYGEYLEIEAPERISWTFNFD